MATKRAVPTTAAHAAMIARVSLEKSAKNGYSLDAQVSMMTELIEREGFVTCPEYVLLDDGFEGDDWSRPAINQALKLIRTGTVRAVAFLDTDRFSRDVQGGLNMIRKIREAGGEVLFGDLGRYRDDANFELQLNIKLSIAQFEKKKIKIRSKYATIEKIKQGKPHGGRAPYGYRFVLKFEGDNAIVPVPSLVPIVRRIFQWADEGLSLRQIVRRLIAEGVQPPKKKWNSAQISKMLRDETYAGTWHYNKREAVEPKTIRRLGKVRHRRRTSWAARKSDQWLPVKVEPIVDPVLFKRVSDQIHQNKNSLAGQPSDRYRLKGKVWCGLCGGRRSGNLCRGVTRYVCQCRDRATGAKLCASRTVRAEPLERTVWGAVKETIQGQDLERLVAERREEIMGEQDTTSLDTLRERIRDLRDVEFRARRAQLREKDAETFALYEYEIREAQLQRRELQREIDSKTPVAGSGIDQNAVALMRDALETEDRGEQQAILQRAILRVLYHDGRVEIELQVPVTHAICLHEQDAVDRLHANVSDFVVITIERRVA